MEPKQILWIDDDGDFVAALSPKLRREGWDVHAARSAEEGLAQAAQLRPDLILMDVIMDGEHGFAAIESLNSDRSLASIPVIVLSGVNRDWAGTNATREDALLTEAREFIDKGEAIDALVPAIRKHIGDTPQ